MILGIKNVCCFNFRKTLKYILRIEGVKLVEKYILKGADKGKTTFSPMRVGSWLQLAKIKLKTSFKFSRNKRKGLAKYFFPLA